MSEAPEKKYIPENILKRKQRDVKQMEEKAKSKIENKIKKRKERLKKDFIDPEQFIVKYRSEQFTYANARKREVKYQRETTEKPESKLVLVIRIRGIKDISSDLKKVFAYLRIKNMNSAAFVRVNQKTLGYIKKVEPYITYGYPSRQLISDLIYKKGFAKVDGKRTAINNNEIVENNFGEKGLVCIEDLVHEILTGGEFFKEVNSFIWPFKLAMPKSGYKNKKKPFSNGGDWGNREEKINDLVMEMI